MQKNLVSIISPCYNVGSIVHRLLDSVLDQDYPSIEMIVVDDGSTDNTAHILQSYRERFEERGYKFLYIYQENQGQSVAINNALKWVGGEFLAWPDSDDYYNKPTAVSSFVSHMHSLPEDYAVVRCLPTFVDEDTQNVKKTIGMNTEIAQPAQFDACLFSDDFIWPPGNYMIKVEALCKVNPTLTIYTERSAGQNYQMFLPLFYSYKCYTINNSLFSVLERRSSHSRSSMGSFESVKKMRASYVRTIVATINSLTLMPESEKLHYLMRLHEKWSIQRINTALSYKHYDEARKEYAESKKEGSHIPLRVKVRLFIGYFQSKKRLFG